MNASDAKEIARGLSYAALRIYDPATEKTAAVVDTLREKTAENGLADVLNNPYLQNALIGASAGGLVGALQGKKKLRSMLDYALLGGIGGLGTTAAKKMLFTPATPPPAIAAAAHDNTTGNSLLNLGAAGLGAYGGRQAANSLDAYGKLNRFLESDDALAKQLRPTIEQLRANSGPSKITDNLTGHLRKTPFAQNSTLAGIFGADHVPRDVSLPLEEARMRTPASVAGRVRGASRTARGSFLGGIFGRNSDDAANVLAAIASEPASGVGSAGRKLTASQLRAAFRRMPRVGGRLAGIGLPVLGALAAPALLNSFSSAGAGE